MWGHQGQGATWAWPVGEVIKAEVEGRPLCGGGSGR